MRIFDNYGSYTCKLLKMMKIRIVKFILWYSFLIVSGIILQDLYYAYLLIINVDNGGLFVMISSFLIQLICIYCIINLIQGVYNKLMISLFFIYWISQILVFNFFGNSFTFLYGPIVVVYTQFKGDFEWGMVNEFWHHEFIIEYNTLSDMFYVGFNMVAVIISMFFFMYNKTYFKDSIRNKHEKSGENKKDI